MKEKVGIIIQARMGSERLPGKIMMPLSGKPMLWHLIQRMKMVKNADMLIIATTENHKDDAVMELCRNENVACFRGSEMDVLDRYYRASVTSGLTQIVRVTGDNPLTCPEHLSSLIDFHLSSQLDFSYHSGLPVGCGSGMVSFQALEICHTESKLSHHREHVTLYLFETENNHRFRHKDLQAERTYFRPEIRLTVDTPEDFSLIDKIYEKLYNGAVIPLKNVLDFLDENPDVLLLNAHIRQKNPREGSHDQKDN